MDNYIILRGSLTRREPPGAGPFRTYPQGAVVEMTERQAVGFGIENLQIVPRPAGPEEIAQEGPAFGPAIPTPENPATPAESEKNGGSDDFPPPGPNLPPAASPVAVAAVARRGRPPKAKE